MKEVEIIKPIFEGFLKEKEQIEEQIIREGTVPKEICELCEDYGNKRWLKPFTEDEEKDVANFIQAMRENRIASINRIADFERMVYPPSHITIETPQEFGRKEPEPTSEGLNKYTYRLTEFKKRTFCPQEFNKVLEKFDWIMSCAHFELDKGEVVHLATKHKISEQLSMEGAKSISDVLFLCCKECKTRIEKQGCTDGIRKDGFIYTKNCDLDFLVLQKVLKEANLPFELGHHDRSQFGLIIERSAPEFYLREHGIFIILPRPFFPSSFLGRDKQQYEAIISVLKPKLIVCFGNKTKIIDFLGHDTNVLVVSEEGFYFYDHIRQVEESIEGIVKSIVKKLNYYIEQMRGNEHDRLVMAFEKIGQELGYIPKKEHSRKGVRVDCIWYDRNGKIKVAIEVETRGGWKKDIISTWELEPELSIIVTYQKTDSVPEALMNFALMKSLPHKLFYINMETKNGFIFEKEQIINKYSMEPEEKEKFKVREI